MGRLPRLSQTEIPHAKKSSLGRQVAFGRRVKIGKKRYQPGALETGLVDQPEITAVQARLKPKGDGNVGKPG